MRPPLEIADALAGGDGSAVEDAIAYLERDPWEFRSGYAKATLLRRLKHFDLTTTQTARVESILLRYVDVGPRRDFREACVLARCIEPTTLPRLLRRRLKAADIMVAVRALTMLVGLRRPGLSPDERATARTILVRWASADQFHPAPWPSATMRRLVRRLWSPDWAEFLHTHAAAGPDDPLRKGARRLLKAAPRRWRR